MPSGAVPFLPALYALATTLITARATVIARVMRKAGVVASLRSSARVRRAMAVMTGTPPGWVRGSGRRTVPRGCRCAGSVPARPRRRRRRCGRPGPGRRRGPRRCWRRPARAVMPSRSRADMSRAVSGVRMRVVLVAAARSATGPWAASRPRVMTTTSSTVWAASASRWLETSTVRPSPASCRSRSRIHRMPSGSRPLSGSSMISTPGSPSSAAARVSRWRMPREKPPTRRCPASARPTMARTCATRDRGIPAAVAMTRRCSMALRPGWKQSLSSAAPTARAGSGRSR